MRARAWVLSGLATLSAACSDAPEPLEVPALGELRAAVVAVDHGDRVRLYAQSLAGPSGLSFDDDGARSITALFFRDALEVLDLEPGELAQVENGASLPDPAVAFAMEPDIGEWRRLDAVPPRVQAVKIEQGTPGCSPLEDVQIEMPVTSTSPVRVLVSDRRGGVIVVTEAGQLFRFDGTRAVALPPMSEPFGPGAGFMDHDGETLWLSRGFNLAKVVVATGQVTVHPASTFGYVNDIAGPPTPDTPFELFLGTVGTQLVYFDGQSTVELGRLRVPEGNVDEISIAWAAPGEAWVATHSPFVRRMTASSLGPPVKPIDDQDCFDNPFEVQPRSNVTLATRWRDGAVLSRGCRLGGSDTQLLGEPPTWSQIGAGGSIPEPMFAASPFGAGGLLLSGEDGHYAEVLPSGEICPPQVFSDLSAEPAERPHHFIHSAPLDARTVVIAGPWVRDDPTRPTHVVVVRRP